MESIEPGTIVSVAASPNKRKHPGASSSDSESDSSDSSSSSSSSSDSSSSDSERDSESDSERRTRRKRNATANERKVATKKRKAETKKREVVTKKRKVDTPKRRVFVPRRKYGNGVLKPPPVKGIILLQMFGGSKSEISCTLSSKEEQTLARTIWKNGFETDNTVDLEKLNSMLSSRNAYVRVRADQLYTRKGTTTL